MGNTKTLTINVSTELYTNLTNISRSFHSDLNSDLVKLMENYVDSYQRLHSGILTNMLLKE